MSLAADELNVTHGAISRSIRNLEAELGVTLFSGPRNRIELTESGTRLAADVSPAFRQLEAAVAPYSEEEAGFIDVSCLGTFTMRWLIPRLFTFQKLAPLIDVRLTASDRPIDFQREQHEVAVRVDDHVIPEDVRVTNLFPEYVGVIASPSLFDKIEIRSARDLSVFPILRTKTRIHAWKHWSESNGVVIDGYFMDFEHFYFMLEAATAGLGVGVAPWPLVMDDIFAGRLVAPLGFIASGRHYVAARRSLRVRRIERFCEWLAVEAEATARPPVGCGQ